MPETLLFLFYLTGTLFFIGAIILIIGIGVTLWWLTQKIAEFEEEAKERLHQLQQESRSVPSLKASYPLVLSAAINLGYHFLRKKYIRQS